MRTEKDKTPILEPLWRALKKSGTLQKKPKDAQEKKTLLGKICTLETS